MAPRTLQVGDRETEGLGGGCQDPPRADRCLGVCRTEILEHVLGHFEIDRLVSQCRVSRHAGEGSLEFPDVVHHTGGDELEYRLRNGLRGERSVASENRQARLDVGGLNISGEAPLEAAADPRFEVGEALGGTIGREDELLARLVKRVEGMEELFEDLLFPLEELHIVEEEEVHGSIVGLELVHSLLADAVDEVVEELLGRDIRDLELRVE